MTVAEVKKSGKKSSKTVLKADNFKYLDSLMEKIDTLESEDQVPEIFAEEELLSESFNSLMALMEIPKESCNDDDFDCEQLDEKVAEIMSQLLDEGLIDEEEFEDFFTEELVDEDSEDSEDSESCEDTSDSDQELLGDNETPIPEVSKKSVKKMGAEEKKKAKNMKELEMLMEKVDDESDLDDEETETESEEEIDEESFDKKDIFGEDGEEVEGRLSSFEKAQLALKSQIAALENEQLEAQKPWALRGEINARQRPSDSLLEEAVDFDNLSRPTPQITEERTEEIEDVIKRRIGEAAWDDVERKDGRDLTMLNGMQQAGKAPRALLEDVATADPQRSLTQVYEDAATAKLTAKLSAKDQDALEKEAELTALFAKICRHVDGLSGNRFAPKVYVQSDFQIKTLGAKK